MLSLRFAAMPLKITKTPAGVRFAVHVQPRSSRPGFAGTHGDALRVRVTAPPVDGAANEAVVDLLATALGVPRRHVTIVAGQTSRSKVVKIVGTSPDVVLALAAEP